VFPDNREYTYVRNTEGFQGNRECAFIQKVFLKPESIHVANALLQQVLLIQY